MKTSYEFVLPRGYVDRNGQVHRTGRMRLATARDELEPLRDPLVSGPDDPRLTILVLTRVIEQLGDLEMITTYEIEGLFAVDLAFLQDEITGLGVDLGTAESQEEKIQLVHLDREDRLAETIAKSRVLVDLGERVSYRLATEAVNAGVPQIARYEHELITHPINGYVIDDESDLPAALTHFLSGLEHWNQSLVQCRVLQDLFRPQEVLERWGLVKEGAAYAGPADRA